MDHGVARLLSIATGPICDAASSPEMLSRWGGLGEQLAQMLRMRNGFYAYESALLVRPLSNESAPLGLVEWNDSRLWKREYIEHIDDALFFAEDVFGVQYCIRQDHVHSFEPETGAFEMLASSLDGWANDIAEDCEFRTGHPLAQAWQRANGPLPAGVRLIPRIPFLCGGAYDTSNLYSVNDIDGMRWRAAIANQVRDLPDGARVVFRSMER